MNAENVEKVWAIRAGSAGVVAGAVVLMLLEAAGGATW